MPRREIKMEVRNCFYKVLKLLIAKHWMVGLSYINLAVHKNKMVQLTTQERTWICIQIARLQNAAAVQHLWGQQWPGIVPPHPTTIRRNFRKYQAHGTNLNMNKSRSGRRKTARTTVNIRRVCRSLNRNEHFLKTKRTRHFKEFFQPNTSKRFEFSSICADPKTEVTRY